MVAVSIDRDPSLVAPFNKEYGVTFTNLLDPEGAVHPAFGVRYTPTNFFVNRRGQVVGGSLGYRDWSSPEARRLIEALLAEEAPPKDEKRKP